MRLLGPLLRNTLLALVLSQAVADHGVTGWYYRVLEGGTIAVGDAFELIDRAPEADEAARQTLASDAKQRAENLMIVDLLRNDLGRIARTGTVRVPRLFEIEPYPTVWQMTSTIEAELPGTTGLADVLRALFPCGSITGAPKRHTMDLIARVCKHFEDSIRTKREAMEPLAAPIAAAAEAMAVPPARCVLVEDTLEHQKSARRLGMKTVLVQQSLRRPAYVDARLHSVLALPKIAALI